MPETLDETASLLRLEIAMEIHDFGICWCLLDWVKREDQIPREMQRILNRFSRISLSLERQAKGIRSKNEPYQDVVGVRCRMGHRTIGIWSGEHKNLEIARLAPADEWSPEAEFQRQQFLRREAQREAKTEVTR